MGMSADDGNVCMRVAETLFGGKNSGAEVRCADTEKKKLLVYGGDFEDNDITAVFLSYLNNIIDYDKFDVTVLAQSETGSADERINSVLDAVRVLYWKPFYEATLEEFARHLLMEKRDPESKMCPPYEFYRRELTRAAGDSKFDYAVSFADSSAIFNRISAYSKDMKKIDVKEAKLKNSVDVKGIEEELQNQTILDDGGNRYYIAGIKNCGEGILEAKTIELPSKDRLNVVTLGRFLRENHYEKLIKEFDLICRERQDAHLYFIGDGEVREKIEKLVADRHLTDKITLLGEVDHPLNFIKQCDCFALENALGEQSPDILKVRALGIPAVWKYSEIRSVLKGSRKQEKLDVDAYNSVVRREFESLFEV